MQDMPWNTIENTSCKENREHQPRFWNACVKP